jgi:hypothetical protein
MEVWVTMIEDFAVTTPILAFAQDGYTPNPDCQGYQIALTQRGRFLELRYKEEENCRIIVLRQKELTRGCLQQVVVVWSGARTAIYLDGTLVAQCAQNRLDPQMGDWDESQKIFLMGSHHEYGSSLSMLSIYNQALSEFEVSNLYSRGKRLIDQSRIDRLAPNIDPESRPIHASTEDTRTVVELGADLDLSALNATVPDDWIIMVEISSVPIHGSLSNGDGFPVNLHDRLFHPSCLNYNPVPGYFNLPNTSYNGTNFHFELETFSYRVLVVDYDQEVLAMSTNVSQQLAVLHVNHRPVIKPPHTKTRLSNEEYGGSIARPGERIEGVQVIDDTDKDIDRIRVDLWVSHGALVLENHEIADFTTCRLNEREALLEEATWGCHGSGKMEHNMTFVATPSNASTVLSDIVYHGFRVNQADELVIRIYDGTGGSCLSIQEHQRRRWVGNDMHQDAEYGSAPSDTCFEVLVTIPIPPFSGELKNELEDQGSYMKQLLDTDNFSRADGIFWGLLGLFILYFCLSVRSCVRCVGARGSTIYVGNAVH